MKISKDLIKIIFLSEDGKTKVEWDWFESPLFDFSIDKVANNPFTKSYKTDYIMRLKNDNRQIH